MTYRLVGLMSVVLVLSLGAFALLVGRHQDLMMDELMQTVSQVSRETLRTVEELSTAPPQGGTTVVTAASLPPELLDDCVVAARLGGGGVTDTCGMAVTGSGGKDGALSTPSDSRSCLVEKGVIVMRGQDGCGVEPDASQGTAACTVQLEGVRAEMEAGKGLLLRIPTCCPGRAMAVAVDALPEGDPSVDGPAGGDDTGTRREIQVSVSTQDYSDLNADMRRHSLGLALGVFVLAGGLTVGLAARFTRPIRRLDEGIRSLADGNLDVEVEVSGADEVGRLGRTFNEMTRRLRSHRDRARELARREKQTALGRLAAGVAHDVRNPLHSVGLTIQHLQETCRPEDAARAREFDRSVETVRREIGRLDQLVGNFLRFARSAPRVREPIQLGELLRDTLGLVEKEAERRRVTVTLRQQDEPPTIMANGDALRASVLNLVLNSFDAMPDGGNLELRLGASDEEVWLEVADSGEGIPEEDHDKVFEFSYTTRDGGHGLGLAMVYEVVVEEHGGRITLDSRPGEGTRLRFALPLDEALEARG